MYCQVLKPYYALLTTFINKSFTSNRRTKNIDVVWEFL